MNSFAVTKSGNNLPLRTNQDDGLDLTKFRGTTVVQIACILDDSGSMQNGAADIIRSYNNLLKQNQFESQRNPSFGVALATYTFQNEFLQRPVFINHARELDDTLYIPNGATPLYETTLKALSHIKKGEQAITDKQLQVRSGLMIFSDGEDTSGSSPETVAAQIKNMAQNFSTHVIGIGLEREGCLALRKMGIALVYDSKAPEFNIRELFKSFTTRTVRGHHCAPYAAGQFGDDESFANPR